MPIKPWTDEMDKKFLFAGIRDKETISRTECERLAEVMGGEITWNTARSVSIFHFSIQPYPRHLPNYNPLYTFCFPPFVLASIDDQPSQQRPICLQLVYGTKGRKSCCCCLSVRSQPLCLEIDSRKWQNSWVPASAERRVGQFISTPVLPSLDFHSNTSFGPTLSAYCSTSAVHLISYTFSGFSLLLVQEPRKHAWQCVERSQRAPLSSLRHRQRTLLIIGPKSQQGWVISLLKLVDALVIPQPY
jgi:hypothetical protein